MATPVRRRARFLTHSSMPTRRGRGDDGLTDAERAESAARWNAGAGATPSRDEMQRLRRLAGSARRPG